MKEPKQKPQMGKPKIIEKTLRTPDRVRSFSSKMKENMPDGDNKNANEYASDNITENGEYLANKGIESTGKAGKKVIRQGYDSIRQNNKPYDSQTTDIKQKQSQRGKTEQAKKTYKNFQRDTSIIDNNLIDNNARDTKTKEAVLNKSPKIKGSANIKTNSKTIKQTKRTIKTAKQVLKNTVKTSKKSVKAAKKAAAAAKKAAQTAAKVAKLTAKAIASAVKAAIAAIKGLVAAIAVGGWIVIVIILVITLILILVSSPWGVFFEDTDDNTPTISELVVQMNNEYSEEITSIISNAGEINEIIMDGDTDKLSYEPYNWIDVIGVFAVKSSANPNDEEYMDVLIIDDRKVKKLKDVFWSMNTISYEIIEEIIEPDPTPTPTQSPTPYPSATPASPSPEPTPEIYRTLIISTESLTYEQGAELYRFNNNQNQLVDELMSAEYYSMFMEICGMSSFNGLTPEQAVQLINELPEGELGAGIVRYALSRLGDPYSQAKRGQDKYVDCSYFARWCYQQAGVSSFTPGTAAEQARYCVNNNLSISKSALKPGDLIFWSFNVNGRYLNITHVGIYAGNGMVIDASSSRGMVVYREMFGWSSIVVCGRPHIK